MKKNLKNIGIAIIMLGGLGLIFIPANTAIWYVSAVIAVIGFFVMSRGSDNKEKDNGTKE